VAPVCRREPPSSSLWDAAGPGRDDRTLLASFRLVAGRLLPPWALSPGVTGSAALPAQLPPVPVALGGPRPRWHRRCGRYSHWHLVLAGRGPWRPASAVAWWARGVPGPGMSSSLASPTSARVFGARCLGVGASLTTGIVRPGPACASFATGIVFPEPTCGTHCRRRRCLALRLSRVPRRRWSRPSPASGRRRPVCPRSFLFRSLLCNASRSALAAHVLLSGWFSTSFLLPGGRVFSRFVEASGGELRCFLLPSRIPLLTPM
jgi:hypothetical protein